MCLLGEPAFVRAGTSRPLGLPARAILVLAHVVVRYRTPIARGRLAAHLWPDIGEAEALANLRRCLHLIVRAIPELHDALELTKTHVRWNVEARATCDVIEFLQAAEDDAEHARAIGLYRDELCAGQDDPALDPIRADVAAVYGRTLHAYVEAARERGDLAAAIVGLKRLLASEPYDEELVRALVSACLQNGDRAGALREYSALVRRLREDLDVKPQEATSALLPGLLGGVAQSKTPNNLTRQSDAFLARDVEMQEIVDGLAVARVVSISGGAGIGKTRLAVEAAHAVLDRFAGGVWFVELARCTTLESAYERIAETVGAGTGSPPLESLTSALYRTDILLVLDNLEQFGHTEDELSSAIVARTGARLLTTSRRARSDPAARAIPLRPLRVPPAVPTPPDVLARYPAVMLFLERASKVAPAMRLDFDNARSLGSIARKLDGVPLAIELVASRANLLTLDGIAKRLDDHVSFADHNRTERHVTIDAAIAWSYELLSESEKRVFRSIAVFGESWTFDALESTCAAGSGDIVAIASELVESSLLTTEHRTGDVRLRAYDATRRFAASQLEACDERDARSLRHLEYFARLARTLASDFGTAKERDAFAGCDRERDNFDVALAWATANRVDLAVDLLSSLTKYWIARGIASVGRRAVSALESRAELRSLGIERAARFALAAGTIAREVDFPSAAAYLERAAEGFRTCGDARGENDTRFSRAALELTRGAFTEATDLYNGCVEAFATFGDENGIASSVVNLAQIAWARDDFDGALAHLERARAGFERVGNARGIAHAFRSRALIFGALGRHDEAIAQASEAVLLYEGLEEPSRVAEALSGLCDACTDGARYAEAFAAVLRSFTILQEVGHDVFLMHAMNSLMLACARVGAYEDVLRIFAIGNERAKHIGRTSDGLQEYQDAVALAKASLPAALAEAALASGVALGVDYCIRVARTRHADLARRSESASDASRTAGSLV